MSHQKQSFPLPSTDETLEQLVYSIAWYHPLLLVAPVIPSARYTSNLSDHNAVECGSLVSDD